jgi:hypothetical protein
LIGVFLLRLIGNPEKSSYRQITHRKATLMKMIEKAIQISQIKQTFTGLAMQIDVMFQPDLGLG